jgi:hypothetical protein
MQRIISLPLGFALVLLLVLVPHRSQAGEEPTMVMTVLEARVESARTTDLERAYREGTSDVPPEILETFLVRDTADAAVHRIVTVWTSREALEQMRASGVKPRGVQIFQAAGATPTLSILEVVVHRKR